MAAIHCAAILGRLYLKSSMLRHASSVAGRKKVPHDFAEELLCAKIALNKVGELQAIRRCKAYYTITQNHVKLPAGCWSKADTDAGAVLVRS